MTVHHLTMMRLFRTSAAILHMLGLLWMVLLLAAHIELSGWLASIPFIAFAPMYVFFMVYGLTQLQRGFDGALWACTLANAAVLAMF